MTRLKLYAVLLTGILLGFAGGQAFKNAQATPPETTIETKADHISFWIKGAEVAPIDKNGLQVDGSLAYSAPMTSAEAHKK